MLKKKKKTPHSNTKSKPFAIKAEPFYFRNTPVPDDYLDYLATEYIEWGVKSGAKILSKFLDEKYIDDMTFRDWLLRSDKLFHAHQIVKRIIGNRREEGALEKRFSEKIFLVSAPSYSSHVDAPKDWKELTEYHAALREKEREQGAQNFVVQLDSFREMINETKHHDDGKAEQVQAKKLPASGT
jgi:hypothetical protein